MKYRKKPVIIEAFRMGIDARPDWFQDKVSKNQITTFRVDEDDVHVYKEHALNPTYCMIPTLEGTMKGDYGDYIIKGIQGEIYPCKPDIFLKTYESID